MSVLFSNSASTTLSAGVGDSATSITVADGSVFPAITGSDYFYLTLEVDSDPDLKEIVKCTARSGNTLTIARGQDGTSARTFSTADKAQLRLTAAGLNDVATQADTDTTYSVQDGELSQNNFTDADHTKLDGIAASANNYSHPSAHAISFITGLQTALDGKVDDSQVLTNVPANALFTDTNTTYSVGDGGLTQINFTSADHTKLNGIEASATADQTAAQILTAIKTVDGAGSGLDADLLDGATSSVFFKSPSNVSGWLTNDRNFRVRSGGAAAGFFMEESDGTFGFQIYGDSGQYGFLDAAWGNWDIQKVVNGTFRVDEGSGLVRVWNAGNDGSGSGLDADLLDGQQGSYYYAASNPSGYTTNTGTLTAETVSSTNAVTITGAKYFKPAGTVTTPLSGGGNASLQAYSEGGNYAAYMGFHRSGHYAINWGLDTSNNMVLGGWSAHASIPSFKVVTSTRMAETGGQGVLWGAANDGSGSGLDADLLDGLQLHTGRNHEANKVVRTNSSGYIDAGWINTTSGDSGIVNDVARIYCSNDGYLRYLGKSEFKVLMGLSKSTYDRRDSTSNSHYWQGTNGYGAIDMNTLFLNYGSGAIDTWSSPANQPSGSSHWVGQQMLHYSTGSVGHGWQLVMGAGNPSLIYARGTWGGGFTSWAKMWNSTNDGSGSGLDADTCDGQHLGTSAAVQFGSVTSSGNVTAYSDRRIKENITPITEALSKVQSLTGNTYTRNDQEDTVTRYAGLIAQEVEQVLPEAVKENDDGIKALDYNATIALLVESIKELKAEVDDLKTRLENK